MGRPRPLPIRNHDVWCGLVPGRVASCLQLAVAGLASPQRCVLASGTRPRPLPHSAPSLPPPCLQKPVQQFSNFSGLRNHGEHVKNRNSPVPCPEVGSVGQGHFVVSLLGSQLHTACEARVAGVLSVAQLQWGQRGCSPTCQAGARSCPGFLLLSLFHPDGRSGFPSPAVPPSALAIHGLSLPPPQLPTQQCLFCSSHSARPATPVTRSLPKTFSKRIEVSLCISWGPLEKEN